MSHDDMENYRASLKHIVRPEDPSERAETRSITINDYEGLYLYNAFVEYASYEAETADAERIALGYAEYINMVVRKEGKGIVRLYLHTDEAEDVLLDAIEGKHEKVSDLHTNVVDAVADE